MAGSCGIFISIGSRWDERYPAGSIHDHRDSARGHRDYFVLDRTFSLANVGKSPPQKKVEINKFKPFLTHHHETAPLKRVEAERG